MKYVFWGTPQFAAIVLRRLGDCGLIPSVLVANPDRPVGRKKIITPPPTKQLVTAQGWDTEILQSERASELVDRMQILKPDLYVIAAYAHIIPHALIAIPRLGVVGVHPSLLPLHRGPTPIQSALLHGDHETGTSLFLIDEQVDHGPVLAARRMPIEENATYETLLASLAEIGGELLCNTLPKFVAGHITSTPQDDARATFTKKFSSEDGFVLWENLREAKRTGRGAEELLRKIRALNPEPGIYTRESSGKRLKLLRAHMADGKLALTLTQREGETPKSS